MSENKQVYFAGRNEKSDIEIEYWPGETSVLDLQLTSSVQALFGRHLRQLAEAKLKELGVKNGRVILHDQGALDFVIIARIEAVVQQGHGTLLPLSRSNTPAPSPRRLRRTRLYLPGNNPDLMINAGLFGADCLILDLEDSVAPAEKNAARLLVRRALTQVDFGSSERIVRINPSASPYGADDLKMIVPMAPETLLIPKCETRQDILQVEDWVSELEKQSDLAYPIQFMPLIESARGVLHAEEIASASQRNVALCFGAEDFAADIGAERTLAGKESLVGRSLVILAARAAGLQALDTVYSQVQDEEGLISSTREAISLGFDGKGVIHPCQIKPIHQLFCPTQEQIEKATQIIAAMEAAKGTGVIALAGKMIDAPVLRRAERTLALAKQVGVI